MMMIINETVNNLNSVIYTYLKITCICDYSLLKYIFNFAVTQICKVKDYQIIDYFKKNNYNYQIINCVFKNEISILKKKKIQKT